MTEEKIHSPDMSGQGGCMDGRQKLELIPPLQAVSRGSKRQEVRSKKLEGKIHSPDMSGQGGCMLSTVVGAKSRTAGFKRLFLMGVPLLGLMLLAAKPVEAANASANIVLRTTVTIRVSLVAGNTWFNFGDVSAAATRISTAPIIFRNDSEGAICRWDINIEEASLALPGFATWTLGAAPGADRVALFALISTFTPTAAMFVHTSTLSTTAKEYNEINFHNASYSPHGHLGDASKILPESFTKTAGTGQSADRKIWLKLQTPTLVTDQEWRTLRLRVTARMALGG